MNNIRKYQPLQHPSGLTRPGWLPTSRLSKFASVVAQQHEALHHLFNSLTTIGNGIVLLSQLAEKCPGKLARNARLLAHEWNDAQIKRLEGLICYVSYKRAIRRNNKITREKFESDLTKNYLDLFRFWLNNYDNLPIPDPSKDSLAIHVGIYCLNLPLYDYISDLSQLQTKTRIVTEQLIESRFTRLEKALLYGKDYTIIIEWDENVSRLWSRGNNEEINQRDEAEITDKLFKQLVPDLESVPRIKVPQSVSLAKSWNEQILALGMPESCRVKITNVGYLDSTQKVIVQPAAPNVSNLYYCNNPKAVLEILNSNDQFYCLAILHRNKEKNHVFSHKYNRILNPGDTYIRFSFVKPNLEAERYDIFENRLFTIFSPEQNDFWLSNLNHPRLIITQSESSECILKHIVNQKSIIPINIWNIHWGQPISFLVKQIISNHEEIKGVKLVEMMVSNSVFLIIKFKKRDHIDIYPISWDTKDSIHQLIKEFNLNGLSFDSSMLLGVFGLITSEAF